MTATLAFAACSQAQENANSNASPINTAQNHQAIKSQWDVILPKSHVKFTAQQQGQDFTGQFNKFDANIQFNPDNLDKARVSAMIDISSISAGDKDRDGALPGSDWFFVKKFPKAVFKSDDFTQTGQNSYAAAGVLSIKGVNHPLTLPFTLDISNQEATMNGRVTIDRTLWGIGSGAWSNDEWVSTSVIIDIKIQAEAH